MALASVRVSWRCYGWDCILPQRQASKGEGSGLGTLVLVCALRRGRIGVEESRVSDSEAGADRFPLFPRPPLRGARADGEGGGGDSPGCCWGSSFPPQTAGAASQKTGAAAGGEGWGLRLCFTVRSKVSLTSSSFFPVLAPNSHLRSLHASCPCPSSPTPLCPSPLHSSVPSSFLFCLWPFSPLGIFATS